MAKCNIEMPEEVANPKPEFIPRLILLVLGMPWMNIIRKLGQFCRKLLCGQTSEGMYEVLEYESTLELLDKQGKRAMFQKREKVRYLQDNIIAYQDQAWGDGKILLNYRVTPGKAVDVYKPGRKSYILISLHGIKNKGDTDEFNIEWDLINGFLRRRELWDTDVSHPTKWLMLRVIFPKNRPPLNASIIEGIRQRTHTLGVNSRVRLADGRWLIHWKTDHPRLYEQYGVQWEW